MTVRPATDNDYWDIARLVADSSDIVRHTSYTYWLLRAMSPESMVVRAIDGDICGFLAAILHFGPNEGFLLQVAVASSRRRQGIGRELVGAFINLSRGAGNTRIRLTIDPRNEVSEAFFGAVAKVNGLSFAAIGSTGDLGGILEPERIWELRDAP